ncbi:sensor histidine kinase [Bordetella trematum]|uniref:sensor histidine kinase n=1 Tax=Bordetella trematum TaxID=123899 RepID=UPI000D8E6200|nr:ATP-binding protein [Bordetella trematum]SPU51298.1 two-component sensor histidine kinase [Bordetella trematum]VDH05639.1 Sensor protein degS [Bordetella trematum]
MLRILLPIFLFLALAAPSAPGLAGQSPACQATILSTQAARGTAWKEIEDRPVDAWVDVTLSDSWVERWPAHDGTVWYRIEWLTDCSPAQLSVSPLALSIDSMNMAGRVFVNGDLLWSDDSLVEPLSRSWNMPRLWTLPAATVQDGVNTILVQVQGAALTNPGLGELRLGDPRALRAHQDEIVWRSRTMFMINIMGSLSIAFLFFGIWLFYRKYAVYMWFCLLNICWAAFIYNIVATHVWPFSSTLEMQRFNAIALMLFFFCFTKFVFNLAGLSVPRSIGIGIPGLTISMSILVALVPESDFLVALKVGVRAHLLLFASVCLLLLWRAFRRKTLEDWLYGGIGLSYILIGIHDWSVVFFKMKAPLFTPYAYPVTMLGISVIMGMRVASSMRRVERFNLELQSAVEAACLDLKESLEKKHELELITTKLQERVELIQDIHDGFGSSLVRAIALAESDKGIEQKNSKHISTLKSLRDDLRLVIDSGRNFSDNIPKSPQAWLASTRYQFSSLFDSIGIKSTWLIPSSWKHEPSPMFCLTLTRFLEEALSNVLKHSQATEVSVCLSYSAEGQVILEVIDNGKGFDVAAALRSEAGVGLGSMESRFKRLGGSVEMHSGSGGTRMKGVLSTEGP